MKRIRKIVTAIVIFTIVSLFVYLSKPDRGGVSRCSRVFGISEIKNYGLVHKPFYTWELFESPKFEFTISGEAYDELARELKRVGYSDWKEGGVTFGSVDVGWTSDEDNVYCELTKDGYHLYWSYSAKKQRIWAITFPT